MTLHHGPRVSGRCTQSCFVFRGSCVFQVSVEALILDAIRVPIEPTQSHMVMANGRQTMPRSLLSRCVFRSCPNAEQSVPSGDPRTLACPKSSVSVTCAEPCFNPPRCMHLIRLSKALLLRTNPHQTGGTRTPTLRPTIV